MHKGTTQRYLLSKQCSPGCRQGQSQFSRHGRASNSLVIPPTRLPSIHLHPRQAKTSKSKHPLVLLSVSVSATLPPPSTSAQVFWNRENHYRFNPEFTRRLLCRPVQTSSCSCSSSSTVHPLAAAQGLPRRLISDLNLARRSTRCLRQLRPRHPRYPPHAREKHGALAFDPKGGRLLCERSVRWRHGRSSWEHAGHGALHRCSTWEEGYLYWC